MPRTGYVVYVDEAGDDGLNRPLRSEEPNGVSEWLVMSAVVVRESNAQLVHTWIKNLISKFDQHQMTHIHFRKLQHEKRLITCSYLADLPIRIFSVLSHKKNMKNYVNVRARESQKNKTAWFYCWMSRLLLERVSAFCGFRTMRDYSEIRSMRVEFSDRGGVNLQSIREYFEYLFDQSRLGMLFIKDYDLDWRVFDKENLFQHPNQARPGLQLADVVASAFFQGIERTSQGIVRPEYAKLLEPRIAQHPKHKRVHGFGVKVMPTWIPSRLPSDQREILSFYDK